MNARDESAPKSGLDRLPGWLLVTVAVFSVQFGNATGGALFDYVGPLGAASPRVFFAAIILVSIVRPKVRSWGRMQWIDATALGLAMAGMNACIYVAIDYIPIGIAVTIELLGPIAVAAFGMRRAIDALWIMLAIGGIVLLGSGIGSGVGNGAGGGTGGAVGVSSGSGPLTSSLTSSLPLAGILAALAAAGFWALYILASAKLGAQVRGVDGLAVALTIGAVALLPLGAGQAVSGVTEAPWLLLAFVGIALVTSVIPYGLEFIALKRMPPRVFGVMSSLGPAVAVIAGFVVLGQGLTPVQVGAIVLVVIASAGAVLFASRQK